MCTCVCILPVCTCWLLYSFKLTPNSVIGPKVNMAARLMMKFPNAITCDDTTRKASGLSENHFLLMPPTKLKGISEPQDIYSFITDEWVIQQ